MGEVVDAVGGAVNSFLGNDRTAPGAPNLGYDPAEVKRLKEERKAALDRMSGATPIKDKDGNIIGYSGDTYESRALNRALTGDQLLQKNNELIQRNLGMLPKTDAAGRPIIGIDPTTGENITAPGYGDVLAEGQNLKTILEGQGQDLTNYLSGADTGYKGMREGLTGAGPDSITSRRGAYEDMFTGEGSFSDEMAKLAATQTGFSTQEKERLEGFADKYGGLRGELGTAKSELAGTTGSIEELQQESKASREALSGVGQKISNLEGRILSGSDKTGLFAGELEAQRAAEDEGQRERLRRAAAQSGDANATRALMAAEEEISDKSGERARRDAITSRLQGGEEGRRELQTTQALADIYEREKSLELSRNQVLNQMLDQTRAKQNTTMQGASLTQQDANLLNQQNAVSGQAYNVNQQGQGFLSDALRQRAQFAQTGAGMVNQDEATRLNEANLMSQQLAQQRYGLDANRQRVMDQNMMNNQQLGYLENMRGGLAGITQQNMNQLSGQNQIQSLENTAGQYASMPLQYIQGDLDEQTQARLGQANLAYQSDMAEYNAPSMFDKTVSAVGATAQAKLAFKCIPEGTFIDIAEDYKVNIRDIGVGAMVLGFNGEPVTVLQKHEYLEKPEGPDRFLQLTFDDESEVNVCDMHRIDGVRSGDYKVGDKIRGREIVDIKRYGNVRISYDLLTEDQGYRIDGIPVNSMIEEMAEATAQLMKAA